MLKEFKEFALKATSSGSWHHHWRGLLDHRKVARRRDHYAADWRHHRRRRFFQHVCRPEWGALRLARPGEASRAPTMTFGLFINSVISFTIVAFVLFMVVKAMNQLRRKQEEDPAAEPPPSREVELNAGDRRRSSQRRRRRGAWQDAENYTLGRARIFRFQRIARLRRFAKQARKKKILLSGF